MTNGTMRRITTTCTALKTLRVEQPSEVLKMVKLKKIVMERWVCRNLSYLELTIAAKTFNYRNFYQDSGDYEPSEPDQDLWEYWKKFYRQLGQLTMLQ
ncbi:hypothetical protein BGX24_008313, partial [Mortierella sp. AD032]